MPQSRHSAEQTNASLCFYPNHQKWLARQPIRGSPLPIKFRAQVLSAANQNGMHWRIPESAEIAQK